jgi:hypothetical protein
MTCSRCHVRTNDLSLSIHARGMLCACCSLEERNREAAVEHRRTYRLGAAAIARAPFVMLAHALLGIR